MPCVIMQESSIAHLFHSHSIRKRVHLGQGHTLTWEGGTVRAGGGEGGARKAAGRGVHVRQREVRGVHVRQREVRAVHVRQRSSALVHNM